MPTHIHPAPLPVPAEVVNREWSELAKTPELTATSAWVEACRAWWDSSVGRLRERTLSSLHLQEDELVAWRTGALDEGTLIRAQEHVTTTRAGVEVDTTKRTLITGLRTARIVANHHDGSRTVYVDASEVRRHVATLAATLRELPPHPILRAAWLLQAIGAIHPFADSNGGTSRFVASLDLSRAALPPFALTALQRELTYVPALMQANEHRLWPLVQIVYESTHQTLAALLLDRVGDDATWTSHEQARADRWMSIASATWQRALGAASSPRTIATRDVVARFARRGTRLPISPEPRCSEWHSAVPLPLQLDLLLVPVRGGDRTWLLGCLDASIGDGQLAAIVDHEPVAEYFVAPANEPDDVVDARFSRWNEQRVAQSIRGLARWL